MLKVSIYDPAISEDTRKLLLCVLEVFVKETVGNKMDPIEAMQGAIGLYETGFLKLCVRKKKMWIEPCLPENAPQLKSKLAGMRI